VGAIFMLDILRFVPQISVIAVALLSVFTVGYFSKVGLHLLGVIDVTNLVYSFGLAFGFVCFVVTFVNWDTTRFLRWASEGDDLLPVAVKCFHRVILPILIIGQILYVLSPKLYVPKFFGQEDFILAVFFMSALWILAIIFLRYERENTTAGAEVSGLVFLAIMTVYFAGRSEANEAILKKKDLYEIVLKDSNLRDVRIVRSSSNGFIFAINGIVKYLPKEEVRMLTAQTPIEE
jgi:hypothetical protein